MARFAKLFLAAAFLLQLAACCSTCP